MRVVLAFLALFALETGCASATCVGRRGPCTAQEKLAYGGRTRTYRVHLPSSHDPHKPQPAMVVLHGRLGTGVGMEKLAHFDEAAEKQGFVLIEPDGVRRSWADARGTTPASRLGVDDLGFLTALIDELPQRFAVDPKAIAVAGMSNGAFTATTLACARAQEISAVALVAGGFSDASLKSCAPSKPLSVLMIHGDADPFVPSAGGELNGRGVAVGAREALEHWAALDGCTKTEPSVALADNSPDDGTTSMREGRAGCREGARVELVTVENGGHTWPGGWQYLPARFVGRTSRDFSATDLIAAFVAGK